METFQSVLLAMHLTLLLFTSSSAVKHNNVTDLSALLAIKAQVIERDPGSIMSANWTTDASFCTWMGVSCSRRRQRVTALNVSNMPLYGAIPPHISNLSFLSLLWLSNDSLVGTIPESLARLPRLKVLKLDSNQLSGSVPPAFFNMSSLMELHLGSNSISGTLPSNDSNFHPLFPPVMAISYNQLTGSIPSSLCSSRTLQTLSLSYNQLTGNIPSEIGNMKQLNLLYLGSNYLTGTIPSALGNLTNLSKLSLSSNSIHGSIPEELGRLTNLDGLQISDCGGITGPIPTSLSNLSSLTVIELANNSLTGPVRLQFGNMANLSLLELLGNKLTGGLDFLASLSNCRVLDSVEVSKNELDGILPYTVGNLSRTLTGLDIQDNRIKGKIPVELGNLTGLTYLDLSENELVGTIPSEITTLQGLQYLSLDSNRIYGSIPHVLGRLSNLDTLYLSGNSLSGSIPDSLGNITGLERLTLFANRLSSTIPEIIGSLTRLQILNLSRNLLTGSLPLTLWNMDLYSFDVSVNQLSGNLPSPPKYLEINYLDLSNNSFDGHIPESFGDLINLEHLDLSCNKLSGVIPKSLVKIRHLDVLNLSFNKLEGKVPNGGAFLNVSVVSLEGNAALCGAPRLGLSSCNPSVSKDSNSRRHLLRYILPVIAASGILLLGFCILLRSCRRRAKNLAPTSMLSPTHHRLISYYELVRATDNFSEINLLGMGTFGSVYRGLLDDGLLVAIKVLNLEIEGASRSFNVECRALRMVRHRNLVRIFSACSNLDFKALVLQFMPNGSLERWLYSHNYCLDLPQRINIVIDVASALDYLHHHHSEVILHCDLKPSNILLDEEMVAHVSDLGIAKLMLSGVSRSVTSASTAGTIGYIAPEYASTGRVSTKADVYSFGILLLEIFTRKKPVDPMFTGESSLRRWVNDANPTGLLDIVDCNLLKDENGNERPESYLISTQACLSSIMELGIICSSDSPKERLAMKDVVPQLQKIKMKYNV